MWSGCERSRCRHASEHQASCPRVIANAAKQSPAGVPARRDRHVAALLAMTVNLNRSPFVHGSSTSVAIARSRLPHDPGHGEKLASHSEIVMAGTPTTRVNSSHFSTTAHGNRPSDQTFDTPDQDSTLPSATDSPFADQLQAPGLFARSRMSWWRPAASPWVPASPQTARRHQHPPVPPRHPPNPARPRPRSICWSLAIAR